jgi:hypothetical protein
MSENEDYKKYWPAISVNNSLIAGAMEVGKDLFILGSFGGFGGHLGMVYPDKDWAIKDAKEWNASGKSHLSVYRLTCSLEVEIP